MLQLPSFREVHRYSPPTLNGNSGSFVDCFENTQNVQIPPVRKYDEEFLFSIYCACHGRIKVMLETVEWFFPIETRRQIPKRAALYKIAKKHSWVARYPLYVQRMEKMIKDAPYMTLDRLDKIAGLVMSAYHQKLIQSFETGDFSWLTVRDVYTMWYICRVERGLPVKIVQGNVSASPPIEKEKWHSKFYKEKGERDYSILKLFEATLEFDCIDKEKVMKDMGAYVEDGELKFHEDSILYDDYIAKKRAEQGS